MKTKKQLPRILFLVFVMALYSASAMATLKVKGWISDANDDYVAGATVSICDDTDTPLFTTTSDRWGDYSLSLGEGLVGEYTLKVTAPGYSSESKTVTLTAELETLKNQDFVLQSNSTRISGFITDATSSYKYVSGAIVKVSLDEVTIAETTSDYYTGYSLVVPDPDPEKVYVLTVSKSGYDTLTQNITLTPGENLDLSLKLYPEGTTPKPVTDTEVTGTVKSSFDLSPITGATITLADGETTLATATSDDDGNFKILLQDRILSGEYTLTATAEGYAGSSEQVKITDGKADPVSFRLDEKETSCHISVSVTSVSNSLLSDVKGTIYLDNTPVATATSSWGAMEFTVNNVVPDKEYVMTFEKSGYDTLTQNITLTPGENLGLSLKLYPEGTTPKPVTDTEVTGTVKSSFDLSPITGATITLADGETTLATATSDDDGNFKILLQDRLLSGEYTLTATAEGYAGSSEQVEIADGRTDIVNFRLDEIVTSCVLTVNVKNESNALLSDVVGTLTLGETTVGTATSNYGIMEIEVENVSTEPYTLTLTLDGYQTIIEPDIELVAGEDKSLSFVMEKNVEVFTTEVKGKTVDKTTGKVLSGVRVALKKGDDTLESEYTRADGAFTIVVKEKLDGEYTLVTSFKGYGETKLDVTITDGVCPEDIVLELEKKYTTLSFIVVDDVTGKPLADADIIVEEQYDAVTGGITDSEGQCKVEFAAQSDVEYDLKVSCRGYLNYLKRTTFNFGEVNEIEVRMTPSSGVTIPEIDGIGQDGMIFNLQGLPVKDLSAPGLYIVVRNGRRIKVII